MWKNIFRCVESLFKQKTRFDNFYKNLLDPNIPKKTLFIIKIMDFKMSIQKTLYF